MRSSIDKWESTRRIRFPENDLPCKAMTRGHPVVARLPRHTMPEGKQDKASGLVLLPSAVMNMFTYPLVRWIALDYVAARE